jgi:hypothetical protein
MLTYVTDYLLHTSPQSEQLESPRPTAVIPLAPVIDPQDLYMRVERAFGQLYGAHVSANDKDVIDALGKRVSLLAPYIRQQTSAHASAYVRDVIDALGKRVSLLAPCIRRRQRMRQHSSAFVSIRQHTSAYVSIRQHTSIDALGKHVNHLAPCIRQHTSAHASAYLSICQPSTSTISPPPVSGKHVSSK